jgi:hypothetical protein
LTWGDNCCVKIQVFIFYETELVLLYEIEALQLRINSKIIEVPAWLRHLDYILFGTKNHCQFIFQEFFSGSQGRHLKFLKMTSVWLFE